jgi:hypothetical protein
MPLYEKNALGRSFTGFFPPLLARFPHFRFYGVSKE